MKPAILISPSWNDEKNQLCLNHDYLDAVISAGGTPLVCTVTEDEAVLRAALDRADGLLLTGGADIDPAFYGEKKLSCCGETAPRRDRSEQILLAAAMEKRMPVLGICRGLEIINCCMGGTLFQDIAVQFARELKHPRYEVPRDCVHTVEIEETSLLRSVVQCDALAVNSRHHQSVKTLGSGLRVCAHAPDGVTEAFEMTDGYPLLAVQWHPESLQDRMEAHQQLFRWLMRESERYRNENA